MTPNPSTAISLDESAEIFLSIGDELSAAFCRRMANDAREMDRHFGDGAGDAFFGHWAAHQAQRAAGKLQAYNQRKDAA